MAGFSMKTRIRLAALGGLGFAAVLILCFPSPIRVIRGIDRFRFGLPSLIEMLAIVLLIYTCFYIPNKKRD
ncbi:MAG: hypothetical protein WCC00_09270 [Candidatus Aminicenantales bacterium]